MYDDCYSRNDYYSQNDCYSRNKSCCKKKCHCCNCDDEPSVRPDSRPFLSSYLEATGNTQTVANGAHVVFDTDPDSIDIVGSDITINASGNVITLRKPGLYHVEWSANLSRGSQPITMGLLENQEPSSAISSTDSTGSISSGALIHVRKSDVPYTISLHNFGYEVGLANPATLQNTAVSIRIHRFADGAAR